VRDPASGGAPLKRYLNQRLKLRHMRIVAAVASQGSLLRAAQALGLTQPALTKSLREVEDIVGVRIFDRHARGVHTNAYGEQLAAAAGKILDILRDVEDGFDVIDRRLGGVVVVGALPTSAAGVMPEVMRRMRASDPQIEVRVVEGRTNELSAALAVGDIDLVVGRLYSQVDDGGQFERVTLYDEPMAFIVGHQHPLAARDSVPVSDIARCQFSLPAVSLRIRADTQLFLEAIGLTLDEGGFTTTSQALLREILLDTELVTVMPSLMARGDILRGTLKVLNVVAERSPPPRPAGLLLRKGRALAAPAARFAAVLTECAQLGLPQYRP
jgi:LysR family transcriptional regulator, pca operon transcriptional activator